MPTVAHVKRNIPKTDTGYNLTDSANFTKPSGAGAGNGVTFSYVVTDFLVLKNATGGTIVFTIIVKQVAAYAAYTITIPDITVSVADAKTHIVRIPDIANVDSVVVIECDDADGEILVLI